MRPDYYAVILWPLGRLSYHSAYFTYTALNFAALLLAI